MFEIKKKAIEEFKNRVRYIGAFVQGPLPKSEKVIKEELPDRNPDNFNHITLFYLGEFPEINESLFDNILSLPKKFKVFITGYGCDGKNQGVSVNSEQFDFQDINKYGNVNAVPHITYSWNSSRGGAPVATGKLDFVYDSELDGREIDVEVKAFLQTGETMPVQYFADRASGYIPEMSAGLYKEFEHHNF